MRPVLVAVLPIMRFTSSEGDGPDLQEGIANARVVHALPDAPAVDLHVGEAKVNSAALNYP